MDTPNIEVPVIVGPTVPLATTEVSGVVTLATNDEVAEGLIDNKAVTPASIPNGIAPAVNRYMVDSGIASIIINLITNASVEVRGLVRLATPGEVDAGLDGTAISPLELQRFARLMEDRFSRIEQSIHTISKALAENYDEEGTYQGVVAFNTHNPNHKTDAGLTMEFEPPSEEELTEEYAETPNK